MENLKGFCKDCGETVYASDESNVKGVYVCERCGSSNTEEELLH